MVVGMGVRIIDLREPVQEIAAKWRRRGFSMSDLISVGMLSLRNMTAEEIGDILETWNQDIVAPTPVSESEPQQTELSGTSEGAAADETGAGRVRVKKKRTRKKRGPAKAS
jgi:malonyl CoA-acyl carrier protein transacylase